MQNEGMLIQIDKEFKNNKRVFCCDVSWISKFPDECEVLFARHLYYNAGFQCKVLDENQGIQTISLSNKQ